MTAGELRKLLRTVHPDTEIAVCIEGLAEVYLIGSAMIVPDPYSREDDAATLHCVPAATAPLPVDN